MNKDFSLYIHIPFCYSKCEYCDFFSIGNNSLIPDFYIHALCTELDFRIKEFNVKSIKSLYIGGGTPSLLKGEQLKKIIEKLSSINKTADFEFTVEVNPDDITRELLEDFLSAGVNRISCGIQSMNESALKFAKRRASKIENLKALEYLKEYWSKKLSLDLICGLPYETEKSFLEGLEQILQYSPDHISMYSLVFEEETPFGKLLDANKISYDFDFADDLWLKGREVLQSKGFFQYETSNFAKPGFECKHNLTYWNHENYIACGSGACASVYKAGGQAYRYTNKKNIEVYTNFWTSLNPGNFTQDFIEEYKDKIPEITEEIDLETSIFEYFMMGLRKTSGISSKHYKEIFGQDISVDVINKFKSWEEKGLCEILKKEEEIIYRMTFEGSLFLNKFLSEL